MNALESDEILVQRLLPNRNSDRSDRAMAWKEWHDAKGLPNVLAFIRAKNDTPEPDMDIFQEALITAYMQVERGNYQPRAGVSFAAYVKGIARNKIREARRRTWRVISMPADFEQLAGSDGMQPEVTVERQEQQAVLLSGLSMLSSSRRRVIEAYLQGHTTAEIARRLGMSEELVRQHKSRGLRGLRRRLEQSDQMNPNPAFG